MSSINIFNLTDVETPVLKQFGLVGATIAVGRALVAPGSMVTTGADDLTLGHLRHFIEKGALAVGTVPPSYTIAKERLAPKKEPEPAPEEKHEKLETYVPFKRKRGDV